MTRYLMYNNKLNNMEDKRLPKIVSKSSRNHHRLKRGWHKDEKKKLRYYKDVMNPNLEDQNWHWSIPKTPWD
jgi:hypothetical protein